MPDEDKPTPAQLKRFESRMTYGEGDLILEDIKDDEDRKDTKKGTKAGSPKRRN